MVKLARAWDRFWFTPADPIRIAVIRIVTGLTLLWTHLTTLPDLLDFIGRDAIVEGEAMRQLRTATLDPASADAGLLRSGDQSLYYYVDQPWLIWTLHIVFVVALVCFTIGLFSRTASIIVWAGHLSYIQRAVLIYFGFDAVVAMLTFYLMFAPTGAALSVDSRLTSAAKTRTADVGANVVLRLIQLHICIIYLASGVAKLFGTTWRSGAAVYNALHMSDVALLDFARLGGNEHLWIFISKTGSYFTLAAEIGFPLLVWHRRSRPFALAGIWLLQLGIGVFLYLGSFQAALFAATLAFVPAATFRSSLFQMRI